MKGHTLILDGDFLGITPNSTLSEVRDSLKNRGVMTETILFSHCIIIGFGDDQICYFKDRDYGRCDFKPDPKPENPICGW